MYGVGEERLLRREGESEGCLRADHGIGAAVLECSTSR